MFNLHNVALLISIGLGVVYPYLSALLTRAPSWLTGVLTMVLSAVSGLVAEFVAAPDGYDWQKATGTALVTLAVAIGTHQSQISGTTVQAKLHAVGTKPAKAA